MHLQEAQITTLGAPRLDVLTGRHLARCLAGVRGQTAAPCYKRCRSSNHMPLLNHTHPLLGGSCQAVGGVNGSGHRPLNAEAHYPATCAFVLTPLRKLASCDWCVSGVGGLRTCLAGNRVLLEVVCRLHTFRDGPRRLMNRRRHKSNGWTRAPQAQATRSTFQKPVFQHARRVRAGRCAGKETYTCFVGYGATNAAWNCAGPALGGSAEVPPVLVSVDC